SRSSVTFGCFLIEFLVMKLNKAWFLGFSGALTFYWVAATSGGFDWVRHFKLARSSATAEAVVTRTEPNNHCAAFYEFVVEGKTYQNSGPDCDVHVGTKMRVHYLPG